MEFFQFPDLLRVRAVPVRSGNLQERRQPLELRMCQEDAEILAEQAFADVVVAVAVRAERRLRVVRVQRAQSVESDQLVELSEDAIELLAVGHVVAGGVEMARIEADPEPLVPVERRIERRELFHRAADRVSGAGRVLDQ
jgi:hypothetical protein